MPRKPKTEARLKREKRDKDKKRYAQKKKLERIAKETPNDAILVLFKNNYTKGQFKLLCTRRGTCMAHAVVRMVERAIMEDKRKRDRKAFNAKHK